MTDQNHPSATVLDAIIPTNPLVAFSCWIGIASVVVCGLGGGVGSDRRSFGMLSMKKWKMQEFVYGRRPANSAHGSASEQVGWGR